MSISEVRKTHSIDWKVGDRLRVKTGLCAGLTGKLISAKEGRIQVQGTGFYVNRPVDYFERIEPSKDRQCSD